MGKKLKKIIGIAAPIALSIFAPGIGTAIGAGLGASGAWAPALGNALIGAGIGGVTGGGKGALIGGLTGGISGYAKGGGFSDLFGSSTSLSTPGLDTSKWMTGTDAFGTSGSVPVNDYGFGRVVSGFGPGGEAISSVLPEGSYISGSGIFQEGSPFGVDLGTQGYQISGLNFDPNSLLGGGSGTGELSQLFSSAGSNADPGFIESLIPSSGDIGSFLNRTAQAFLGGGGQQSGLSSILSAAAALYSANQGKKAATDIAAQESAAQLRALELQKEMYDKAYADFEPYRKSGVEANTRLSERMGALTKPFSMADFQVDPGYAFRQSEGLKAIDRSQAARGNFYSGGALREANTFNSDLASQEYGNAFNRYMTGNMNEYNMLTGRINTGVGATNSGVSAGQNYANQAGNLNINLGNIAGNRIQDQQYASNQSLARLMGSQYSNPRYSY